MFVQNFIMLGYLKCSGWQRNEKHQKKLKDDAKNNTVVNGQQ